MSNIYKLNRYYVSKKVIKKLPSIINELEQLKRDLDKYNEELETVQLQESLLKISLNLQCEYGYFRSIYNKKGHE